MKKNFFYTFIATVVMMCACTEDPIEPVNPDPDPDPEPEPTEVVVVNSAVVDSGFSEEVTEETATISEEESLNSTTLKYKSWIRVKGQTRADFDETVSVELKDIFTDTDTTVYIKDLELGGYTTSISYEARGSRKEGYVTTTDSVLVYNVNYAGFSFRYEMSYEVAVYDDGVTRQVMPYHPIVNIKDAGGYSYRMQNCDDGKRVYARKGVDHSITFKCNGKDYTLKAKVIVLKDLDRVNGPYVLESRVIDEALECGARIMSSIYVERKWSNGVTEKDAVTLPLNAEFSEHEADRTPIVVRGYKGITILSSYLEDVGVKTARSSYKFISYHRVHQKWVVQYDYDLKLEIPLYYDEAWYDDGYTVHKMRGYTYGKITNRTPQVAVTDSGSDASGAYCMYKIYQWVDATIGDLERSGGSLMIVKGYE